MAVDAGSQCHRAVAVISNDRLLVLVTKKLTPQSAVAFLGNRVSETAKAVAGDELRPAEAMLMPDDPAEPILAAFVNVTH